MQIQFIGTIHNVSSTPTNISYEIGDGYGYIDVRQWLDSSEDETGKTEGVEQDKFVSVIGTIKVFGGKRHISAQTIRPIEDHNEVYHHFLKALHVSQSIRNPGAVSARAFRANPQAQAQGGAAPAGADANSYAAPAAGGGDNYGHLPPMQKKIMEIVSADSSGEGMHVKHVGRMCGAVNSEEVMEAIEQLMGEGLLYSTIDDLVSSWSLSGGS
jgi:replication factor A2